MKYNKMQFKNKFYIGDIINNPNESIIRHFLKKNNKYYIFFRKQSFNLTCFNFVSGNDFFLDN